MKPQELVMGGPTYSRGPPIYRYVKAFRSDDGELRHLLAIPGTERETIVRDCEIQSIAGRRFLAFGNCVYHLPDDSVMPVYFCTAGVANSASERIAQRVAAYLEKGGEAWSREFHLLSLPDIDQAPNLDPER